MSDLPIAVIVIVLGLLLLLGAAGTILYLMAFGERARLQRRIHGLFGNGGARKGGKSPANPMVRRKSIQGKLKGLEQVRNKRRGYKLREALMQAGLAMTPQRFFVASALSAVLFALVYMATGLPQLGALGAALIGGLGVPKLVLNFLIKRRLKAFTKNFADAIDVIVRGIKSGLPVGECMALIGREMAPPVGTEFRLIVEAQRLGVPLDEALQKAVERVPTAELKFFAIVLGIQAQTGGNLAETLSKLSDVLRMRKRMRDKVAAMSSEAKASAGIIGSLPFIVGGLLALVAPDYIGILFTHPTGHMLLTASGLVMSFGIFVMRKMINFDF